jgi:hypothetical protein
MHTSTRSLFVLLVLGLLAACSSTQARAPGTPGAALPTQPASGGAAGASLGGDPAEKPLDESGAGAVAAPANAPRRLDATQMRVIWQALAVERERLENPTHNRTPLRGVVPTQQIVLVSESHPDAKANLMGRSAREHKGVAVAALPDSDMALLLRGLQQRGFFAAARPTDQAASLFANPNARGRITVERGEQSWTLVSMRGQGLNDATKAIPALYSEAKQSIIVLRNQTPTMSVITSGRSSLR